MKPEKSRWTFIRRPGGGHTLQKKAHPQKTETYNMQAVNLYSYREKSHDLALTTKMLN